MPTTAQPSFSDSLALAARRERQQRWRAARTVRAHVGAGEHRDELLACLGLAELATTDQDDS